MNRKSFLFCLSMIAMPGIAMCQVGHIVIDSTIHYGLKIVDGTSRDNCQFIKVKSREDGVVTTYFPKDLTEFALKNGPTYISKKITINGEERQVFLNRLAKGSVTVYQYVSKDFQSFYLEGADSKLIELPKDGDKNYKHILNKYMAECAYSKNNIALVRYRKYLIERLVNYHNICSSKRLPYTKFGVTAGYGISNFSIPIIYRGSLQGSAKVEKYNAAFVGVSFDIPIEASYYSLHANVLFSKSSYSYTNRVKDRDMDMVVNFSSLDIPIQLRYTFSSAKVRPFINGGGVFCYRFKNASGLYTSTITTDHTIVNSAVENELLSDFGYGFVGGAGIELGVLSKSTVSLELRFTKLYSGSSYLGVQHIGLITGFTF